MGLIAFLAIAVVEMSLFSLAVTTYHNQQAARWWLLRPLPVAVLVYLVGLLATWMRGAPFPGKEPYLAGMLYGLAIGLPVVWLTANPVARYVDRRRAQAVVPVAREPREHLTMDPDFEPDADSPLARRRRGGAQTAEEAGPRAGEEPGGAGRGQGPVG